MNNMQQNTYDLSSGRRAVQHTGFVRCWSQPIGIADVQGARQYAL